MLQTESGGSASTLLQCPTKKSVLFHCIKDTHTFLKDLLQSLTLYHALVTNSHKTSSSAAHIAPAFVNFIFLQFIMILYYIQAKTLNSEPHII